ncbi:hypothetical protein J2Z62_000795 [Mycoplasmoides fastidiosum]|uniref:Uncharacterized protein n=1 Tax=Mycoplasmoides fastidiosum TaxID=92758 RepID=A0ABU0M080_9BACT|nr:hypothetical protein [Mycoplasmoides fastidiosum]
MLKIGLKHLQTAKFAYDKIKPLSTDIFSYIHKIVVTFIEWRSISFFN